MSGFGHAPRVWQHRGAHLSAEPTSRGSQSGWIQPVSVITGHYHAYLAGPEQDAALLGAFLFFGIGPVGKLPPSRLGGRAPISGPSEPGHGSFDGLTMP